MLRIPSSLTLLPRTPVVRLETIQTMTGEKLERFLADFSLEEQRQARELWQTYARRPSLISFRANHGQRIRLQP